MRTFLLRSDTEGQFTCRTTIEMSGLNAIEMSSLRPARRTYVYRVQRRRPDCYEPTGTRSLTRPAFGSGRTTHPSRGGAAVAAERPPGTAPAATSATRGRCRPGPRPARPALQPSQGCQAATEGSPDLPQGVPRLRPHLCRGETGRTGPGGVGRYPASLAAGRGPVAT